MAVMDAYIRVSRVGDRPGKGAWSKGGKTDAANCQMLCLPCNRQKGGK